MHQNKKDLTIIVDGTLYLYYYYYGFHSLKNKLAQPFGAIYGFLRMINKMLKKYNTCKKIVIVFDSFKKTFRKTLFKEYKSHRAPMPNELYIQIEPLFKILKNFGVKTITIPGIEADDIIGSLSCKLEKKGETILIVSHDKDMIQLVTSNINILNYKNNTIITPKKIKEKYGIRPKTFIDCLALMGDSSDNIPGVPHIGIKTALFLLKIFSSIKNIYHNIEQIPFLPLRNAKNITIQLKNYKKQAFLSYTLAAIKLDCPIEITTEEMFVNENCSKNISNFCKQSYFCKI